MSKVALITGITGQNGVTGAKHVLQSYDIWSKDSFILKDALSTICSILGKKISIEVNEKLFRLNNTPCNSKNQNERGNQELISKMIF